MLFSSTSAGDSTARWGAFVHGSLRGRNQRDQALRLNEMLCTFGLCVTFFMCSFISLTIPPIAPKRVWHTNIWSTVCIQFVWYGVEWDLPPTSCSANTKAHVSRSVSVRNLIYATARPGPTALPGTRSVTHLPEVLEFPHSGAFVRSHAHLPQPDGRSGRTARWVSSPDPGPNRWTRWPWNRQYLHTECCERKRNRMEQRMKKTEPLVWGCEEQWGFNSLLLEFVAADGLLTSTTPKEHLTSGSEWYRAVPWG